MNLYRRKGIRQYKEPTPTEMPIPSKLVKIIYCQNIFVEPGKILVGDDTKTVERKFGAKGPVSTITLPCCRVTILGSTVTFFIMPEPVRCYLIITFRGNIWCPKTDTEGLLMFSPTKSYHINRDCSPLWGDEPSKRQLKVQNIEGVVCRSTYAIIMQAVQKPIAADTIWMDNASYPVGQTKPYYISRCHSFFPLTLLPLS